LFGPKARDARLDKEVLLDSLGSDVISVTFHAYLSKGVLESYRSITLHGDDTLSTIQLPFPSKELCLQLDGHHM
jgi:hypothetical protein